MSERPVERFHPTSGRIMGLLALVVAVGIVVLGLVDRDGGPPPPVIAAAIGAGIVAWAAMLRPRVWATQHDLVMRNMLHTVSIPLAAIEQVAVRQVLAVSAGEKRYVSPAIGKSWRQAVRSDSGPREPSPVPATRSYPDFVEERISRLAEDARARRGVQPLSDEQLALAAGVRRTWAWPEIVGLVAVTLALVVLLLG
jgi:hypothetical protein